MKRVVQYYYYADPSIDYITAIVLHESVCCTALIYTVIDEAHDHSLSCESLHPGWLNIDVKCGWSNGLLHISLW